MKLQEDKEFLSRLYWACVEERQLHPNEFGYLGQMYERGEETNAAIDAFQNVLTKLDDDSASDAEHFWNIVTAYEMQGFFNGFRICMKMYKECGIG